MSNSTKVVSAVIAVLVLLGIGVSIHTYVKQSDAIKNNTVTDTDSYSASSTDNSDKALQRDTANIDSQMNSLQTDSANIDENTEASS